MHAVLRDLAAWLFQLRSPQHGEIVLVQRRIFILPTRSGLLFALVLVLMLTGAINYALSLGFVLTFLLASLAISAMLHTFRNLAGLRITAARTTPVFAGDTARFALSLQNPTEADRYNLVLTRDKRETDTVDIPAEHSAIATVSVPALRRGLLTPGRMTLYTRFPVGLYHAWSYIELDMQCVVYPRPAPAGLPLPPLKASGGEGSGNAQGREDFAGLRQYHPGDSPRHIAWKAAARDQGMLTKQFSGNAAAELWLTLDLLPRDLDLEEKLSRIARWVLDAHANGYAFGLDLPGTLVPLGTGEAHRERCLEALALFNSGRETSHGAAIGVMTTLLTLRQTTWLIVALIMVAAPHAERLPWWLTLLVFMLIVWRMYLARVRLALPPRAVMVLVVIGSSAGVYLHYGTIFGRDAGVALLVLMLGLKVLETKTRRDGMLLTFLSYFLVITNFLYSQTILTAVYMLACVWVITAAMIGLHYANAPRGMRHQLQTAGVLLAQSVPLMLVLFVLFPRIQGPLWGMPSDTSRATTGLSDTMTPGSLSELTLSEAVAFRATFKSRIPPANRLYWRGPVLWDYDGRTWRAPRPVFGAAQYTGRSAALEYSVIVEPHGKAWLFALDLPARVPPRAMVTSDLQLLSLRPVSTRVRYDMSSYLDYKYGQEEAPEDLARALRLPPGFNPRTAGLARELRARYKDDRALLQAVLTRFNTEGFSYTLLPPLLGEHPVDEFLFKTRSGFCEHYSSALAVVMRAAGIPARVVTGYLGGELNPIGDYLIVRQADAHAWTEIWLKDAGWVRVDPTAAVSPARIEQGFNAAVSSAGTLPLFMRGDIPILREMRLTWDSLANTWNQWVLGYTPETQRALLTRVGLDDATWRTLAALLLAATGIVTLVLTLITLRRLRVRVRDPVKLAYIAFCNKLQTRGLPRQPAEGPLSYAERITRSRPDLDTLVQRFTELYVALRYGGNSDARGVSRLRDLAREFRP